MIVHELTRQDCIDVLQRTQVGRLACARHAQPYIVPISFYFDSLDTSLYSFSTVGQKIHWMRDNPKVCVEVDEVVDRFTWTSVVLSGLYEELRDREDAARAKARALKHLQERAEWWLPGIARLSRRIGARHPGRLPHSDRDDERAPCGSAVAAAADVTAPRLPARS